MFKHPHIVQSEHDDIVVLTPVGEFDISSVDMLRSSFLDATSETSNKVVVDLSATTFLDSMALGTMLGVSRRVDAWGGWVRVVAPLPNVRRVLHVTGLDKVFALYDTVDQAVAHGKVDHAEPEGVPEQLSGI